ncbi:hypothetical protein G6F56_011662 [Rhizopus delemar]|nr:hypothetical protein G6F56_011662 [Rhizopus delemar]
MTQTRFKCTCPKCTRDGKPFTSVSESTYHAHQKDVPTHMRVSTPARSNVVAAALAALATAPRPYSPVLEEQEDPFEYLNDGNEFDDDYDFFPVDPASQDHPLEDDDIYYSCGEEDYSDDESEDELEGSRK